MTGTTRNPFQILAETEAAGGPGSVESLQESVSSLEEGATPMYPDAILDRIGANLAAMSPSELPVPTMPGRQLVTQREWGVARDRFLRTAEEVLLAVRSGQTPSHRDTVVAEAVIIADETRPSFLLCQGAISNNDPLRTHWSSQLAVAKGNKIRTVAKAVGRIQPEHGSAANYFGTGSLISVDDEAGTGRVLTNYHVIKSAQNNGIGMVGEGVSLQVTGHLEIDFLGEWCSLDTNRFQITQVDFPVGAGSVFNGIDAAVVTIEKIAGEGEFPIPVPQMTDHASFIAADIGSLATVGFPARPAPDQLLDDEEWELVIKTLFQDLFGVKRLAPGRKSRQLGSHAHDTGKRAIGHDASTFGGASGSLLLAWQKADSPAFCLHFGGLTASANYALSFHKEQAALAAIGVPFRQ